MKIQTPTRRQVLRGASGATLALPFLPSLASPRGARAEGLPNRRAFVAFTTDHGGLTPQNMYPSPATMEKKEIFPGHVASYAPLTRRMEGNDALVSPVLRAPATDLSERIVSKMLVQRGLDVPFYLSHHWGGHLGNVAGNDGVAGGDQAAAQRSPNPTMDHVMGWSSSFYPNLAGVRERNVVFGSGRFSWGYSSPATKSGSVEPGRGEGSSLDAFERLFGSGLPMAQNTPQRKPLVDLVLPQWKGLRESNTRLSPADRQRLDDYMDRIAELQRRLKVDAAPSCATLKKPTADSQALGDTYRDASKAARKYALINDVIAASIMCGGTRAFVVQVFEWYTQYSGDWHQQVAHTHNQPLLLVSNGGAFRTAMLDLAKKLDVDAGDGGTYLDQSLLHWSQESGDTTHHGMHQAIVTIGGAGGFFKTGLYVDWRNMAPTARVNQYNVFKNAGIVMNHWHANVMLAMGVPPTDWPKVRNRGFGNLHMGQQYTTAYSRAALDAANEPLPIITSKA